MTEPNKDPSEDKRIARKTQDRTSEDHLRIMTEYIFKREGRRATLNEAQDALNNLTRLMKWLYDHRNDLNNKRT